MLAYTRGVKISHDEHTGLISTLPLIATGLSLIAWRPRTPVWGRLMIGVPISEPKTPPLLMVKVPPAMSSMVNLLSRAYSCQQQSCLSSNMLFTFLPRSEMACSMPIMSIDSAFRTTGVTRPFGVATATLMST